MEKQNCWKFKKCGREPGGTKAEDMGVCPAATVVKIDGVNSGKNGGRACWVVAGTLCGGKVQGEFAQKMQNCLECEFYDIVQDEEDDGYIMSGEIRKKLEE